MPLPETTTAQISTAKDKTEKPDLTTTAHIHPTTTPAGCPKPVINLQYIRGELSNIDQAQTIDWNDVGTEYIHYCASPATFSNGATVVRYVCQEDHSWSNFNSNDYCMSK